VPEDIVRAVEDWGKNCGRKAKIAFAPYPAGLSPAEGCFTIFLERKDDDPVRRLYKEGKTPQMPYEAVPLQQWDKEQGCYFPLNIHEYGASGVVGILQKGDMWSGNGEYPSMKEAAKASIDRMEAAMKKERADVNEFGREIGSLHRRTALGIPYVSVGIDLKAASDVAVPGVAAAADEE